MWPSWEKTILIKGSMLDERDLKTYNLYRDSRTEVFPAI